MLNVIQNTDEGPRKLEASTENGNTKWALLHLTFAKMCSDSLCSTLPNP